MNENKKKLHTHTHTHPKMWNKQYTPKWERVLCSKRENSPWQKIKTWIIQRKRENKNRKQFKKKINSSCIGCKKQELRKDKCIELLTFR